MRRLSISFIVAIATFVAGVTVASVCLVRQPRPQPARPLQPAAPEVSAPDLITSTGNLRIKEGGWEMPDFSRYHVTKQRGILKGAGPVKINYAMYEPEGDGSVINYPDSSDKPSRLEVVRFTAYEVGGRRFYLRLLVGPPLPPAPLHGGSRLRAVYYLTFYDEDGDGIFETQEGDVSGTYYIPHVPQWAIRGR